MFKGSGSKGKKAVAEKKETKQANDKDDPPYFSCKCDYIQCSTCKICDGKPLLDPRKPFNKACICLICACKCTSVRSSSCMVLFVAPSHHAFAIQGWSWGNERDALSTRIKKVQKASVGGKKRAAPADAKESGASNNNGDASQAPCSPSLPLSHAAVRSLHRQHRQLAAWCAGPVDGRASATSSNRTSSSNAGTRTDW